MIRLHLVPAFCRGCQSSSRGRFHGDHRRESSAEGVAAFDRDLQALLAENFLQVPLAVLHRVFAATGPAPE